jgi:hypothetical protein
MNFLLTRILWLRRSKWQFLLAGLAFFIGLATLMLALDSYLRVSAILQLQKEQGQFLILNKKISLVNTLGLESASFEKEEINNIRRSGLFQEAGEVHSNKFRAQIISSEYINFQSLVFFESVPRSFLDNRPPDFRWSEGRKDLPIIVSQDFLNLYNFGFAMGQGFPQIGREALKLVSFDVVLDGPGGKEVFRGRVAGFTERIASVLVPEEFMSWANRKIGGEKKESCSRVIVKVANASDPAIAAFLKKFRLVTDLEKMNLGKSGSTLELVMKGLALLGLLFTVLALVMFSMNFRLVMAEAESDIRLLIELGYSHGKIARELLSWFSLLLLVIFALAGLFLFSLEGLLQTAISSQGLQAAGSGYLLMSLLCGFVFTLIVLVWNSILIGNQLRKIA